MLGDIVGYCLIKKDATTIRSAKPLSDFLDKPIRVLEFNPEGDVLVINPEATDLAMFDACDVKTSFKAICTNEFIMPPDLDILAQFSYQGMIMGRKGGYNEFLKRMVIAASLMKGKFDDSILWAKKDETAEESYTDAYTNFKKLRIPRKLKKRAKIAFFGLRTKHKRIKPFEHTEDGANFGIEPLSDRN